MVIVYWLSLFSRCEIDICNLNLMSAIRSEKTYAAWTKLLWQYHENNLLYPVYYKYKQVICLPVQWTNSERTLNTYTVYALDPPDHRLLFDSRTSKTSRRITQVDFNTCFFKKKNWRVPKVKFLRIGVSHVSKNFRLWVLFVN